MDSVSDYQLKEIPCKLIKADARIAGDGNHKVLASIDEIGVLLPVIVQKIVDSDYYSVIKGRVRVARQIQQGKAEILALVVPQSFNALTVEAVANLVRKNISPIYKARLFKAMLDEPTMNQTKLAVTLGLGPNGRVSINNALRLLRLPLATINLIDAGKLSAAHGYKLEEAHQILGEEKINNLAIIAAEGNATVDRLGILISNAKVLPTVLPMKKPLKNPEIVGTERRIGAMLDATAIITPRKKGGIKVTLDLPDPKSVDKFLALFENEVLEEVVPPATVKG